MTTGKISQLYSDKEHNTPIFPKTSMKCVSDDDGKTLDTMIPNMVYKKKEDKNFVATVPRDADSLGGLPAAEYEKKGHIHDTATVTKDGFMAKEDKKKMDLFGEVLEFSRTFVLSTEWKTIDLPSLDIPSGTYVIQIYSDDTEVGFWDCSFSGIMSWYRKLTNDDSSSEIHLHCAGHAMNNAILYARTLEQSRSKGKLLLQLKCSRTSSKSEPITIKLRRLI